MSAPTSEELRQQWREDAQNLAFAFYNPRVACERILALLDALDAAEGERGSAEVLAAHVLYGDHTLYVESVQRLTAARDAARAELAEAEAALSRVRALLADWDRQKHVMRKALRAALDGGDA